MEVENRSGRTNLVQFSPFVQHALQAVVIVAVALFLWQVRSLLLLGFLSVLLAVLLRGGAVQISRRTRLPTGWSLALTCLLVVGVLVGLGFVMGPSLSTQFQQMAQSLPDTWTALEQQIRQSPLGPLIPKEGGMGSALEMLGGAQGGSAFTRVTGVASVLASVLTELILVIVLAVFLASDPGLYKRGILSLVPPARRGRVEEALDAAGNALLLWFAGRLITMTLVGVLTWAGLSLVGAPLPLVLGVIAGLFDFVAFVGPLAAAVPGVLLSLTQGVQTALAAGLVYLAVQQLEGNLLDPIIQRKTVSLPPALTVLAAVGFGIVFGVLGIIVGVPLALTVMVLVKVLYVEGAFHDEVKVPGRD